MKSALKISSEEKQQILEQHNSFKSKIQSKVKRLMINEQTQNDNTKVRDFLEKARQYCKIAKNGKFMSASGKPSVLFKIADYNSEAGHFKEGDKLYVKSDFTFDVISKDETGKEFKSASNKMWKCDQLTNMLNKDSQKVQSTNTPTASTPASSTPTASTPQAKPAPRLQRADAEESTELLK
jgi:hypothetical protein